jgi:hypothetical protein
MRLVVFCLLFLTLAGCANTVDVTKTARGYVKPSDPNTIDILYTRPDRHYSELGAVSTYDWDPDDTAKLHNALRAKAAPLGADAVLILNTGMIPAGWGKTRMWVTGVAIKYNGVKETIPAY